MEVDPVGTWCATELRESTAQSRKAYRNQVARFLAALAEYGFVPDDPAAPAAITNVLADLVEAGNSASTIRRKIEGIARHWRWMNSVAPGAIPDTCFDALKCPRTASARPPIRTLNIEQQAALLSFTREWNSPSWPELHLYVFVSFGLLMALRPAELLHLDWSELHLDEPRPFLRLRTLPRRRIKNDLARQALTLPQPLPALLETYFSREDSGPVFTADNGWAHRPALKRAGSQIGAPWFNLYALRRTCITNWHRQGVELQRLTILSRHANPVILNRHYLERPELADIATGLPVDY